MIVGTATERPMKLAIAFLDGEVVNAGDASLHQAMLIELPILVAVTAEPIAAIVVQCPELLDQPVVELTTPLALEKGFDLLATLEELGAVSPAALDRVGEYHAGGIARVPRILRQPYLLRGGLGRKWRQRR